LVVGRKGDAKGIDMGWRRTLALIGAVEVFVGAFAPIVSVPLLGSANFFGDGQYGSGAILLMLAVASVVLVVLEAYRALWLTGAGVLGVVTVTFLRFLTDMSRTATALNAQLANTPLQGFGTAVAQSIQLEWGWGVLFTGGALLIVAAAWSGSDEDAEVAPTQICPDCAEEIKVEARVCRFCGRRLDSPVAVPIPDAPELGEPLRLIEAAPENERVHLLIHDTDSPEARKKLVTRLAPYFPGKTPLQIESELKLPYLIPRLVSKETATAIQKKWSDAGIHVHVISADAMDAGRETHR
jgi:hypothetical protein